MELTESQEGAVQALLDGVAAGRKLLSLAGSAGTGKTTIIKELVRRLKKNGGEVLVATPTNKAAQVLNSKGITAATFYRYFFILDEEGTDPRTGKTKPVFKSVEAWLSELREAGTPENVVQGLLQDRNKYDHVEILVIDEASMLTRRRILEMQKMCDVLILVGDHHQLPPVGDRQYPAGYFAELNHTAVLTEIMRQAEGSLILELASELRDNGPRVEKMIKHFEPQESYIHLARAGAQAIAFTNKERQRINHVTRKILGFDRPFPMTGDRLLVTNNYSDELVNGTVVDVLDFQWDGKSYRGQLHCSLGGDALEPVAVSMRSFANDQIASVRDDLLLGLPYSPTADEAEDELLEVTFAYCMTAHKAQGSEWPSVVVFDQRGLIRKIQENDDNAGLSPDEYVRRWTYTAITRARNDLYFAPTWFAKAY